MRRRRQPEVIAGRVNADGSIATGDGFTVQKGGTGIFTLTFQSGFRVVGGSAQSSANGFGRNADFYPSSERTVIVSTFATSTATAADYQFVFVAVGVQQ